MRKRPEHISSIAQGERGPKSDLKRRRERLLYVEDDATNRSVTELWLAPSYDLYTATNDVEACEAVIEHHAQLSCILMDIQLQGSRLNGIQLASLFRGKLSGVPIPAYARFVPRLEIPIFFLTAYGEEFSDADLEAAGGNRIIAKPVDFARLNLALTHASLAKAAGTFTRF